MSVSAGRGGALISGILQYKHLEGLQVLFIKLIGKFQLIGKVVQNASFLLNIYFNLGNV